MNKIKEEDEEEMQLRFNKITLNINKLSIVLSHNVAWLLDFPRIYHMSTNP